MTPLLPLLPLLALLALSSAGCAQPGPGPVSSTAQPAAAPHPCASAAAADARRLVRLHLGNGSGEADLRVDIPRAARTLPLQPHPADARRLLQPLELHAFVERGGFRVRLLYAADERRECLAVGREIIDWTGP